MQSDKKVFGEDKLSIHLGTYKTIEGAANAYDSAAIVFFGEFANLNCAWLNTNVNQTT